MVLMAPPPRTAERHVEAFGGLAWAELTQPGTVSASRNCRLFPSQRSPVRGHELGELHRGLAQQCGYSARHGRLGLEARQVVQQQQNQDKAGSQALALFGPEKPPRAGRLVPNSPAQPRR
jgi:hypothetical protein